MKDLILTSIHYFKNHSKRTHTCQVNFMRDYYTVNNLGLGFHWSVDVTLNYNKRISKAKLTLCEQYAEESYTIKIKDDSLLMKYWLYNLIEYASEHEKNRFIKHLKFINKRPYDPYSNRTYPYPRIGFQSYI